MAFRVLSGERQISIRRITVAGLLILGALTSTVIAGDVNYKYDALGRVIEVEYVSDGKIIQYCYDAAGNRTSKIVGSSTVACGSSGGGGGDDPIRIANGLTVLPEHTSFYGCYTWQYYTTYVEYCRVLSSNLNVWSQVNSDPPQYETGYSGNLLVEAAYYNTP